MQKQVIEYAGQPVGIVVPDKDALKFIAVKLQVMDLDAKVFRSAVEAKQAIHDHLVKAPPSHA